MSNFEDFQAIRLANSSRERKIEAEKRRIAQEKMDEAMYNSCMTYQAEMKTKKIQKRNAFLIACAAVLLAANISSSIMQHKMEQETNTLDIYYEDSYIVAKNIIKNEAEEFDHYDNYQIAHDILHYKGSRNIDTVIYMCYCNFKYDVPKQMNEVFYWLKYIIDNEPAEYDDNFIYACYYSNFQGYLDAHGYQNEEEYNNKMQEIMKAYNDVEDAKYNYDLMLADLMDRGGR